MTPLEKYVIPGFTGLLLGEILALEPSDAIVPSLVAFSFILIEQLGYRHLAKTNPRYQSRIPEKNIQHITALVALLSTVLINSL